MTRGNQSTVGTRDGGGMVVGWWEADVCGNDAGFSNGFDKGFQEGALHMEGAVKNA